MADIVIIGGSVTGLMHAVVLKRLGYNVHILERHTHSQRTDLAAGITAQDHAEKFFELHDQTNQPWSVHCTGVQFLAKSAAVKRTIKRPLQMTSWTVLYHRLRANFDGFVSDFCHEAPSPREGDGSALFDLGKHVTEVSSADSTVKVTFDDLLTGRKGSLQADLVILADGASSPLHSTLFPATERKYSGYVAFRGTVPEAQVSDESKKIFDPRLSYFAFKGGYILLYIIPGQDGSLAPGRRRYNWVWYHPLPAPSQSFSEIMTDTSGRVHRNTLPAGGMNPTIWQKYSDLAQEVMCAPFAELVAKTRQPFVTAISDATCPRATALRGKVLVVGEALNLMRPHLALSTTQSAMQALLVERLFRGEISLRQWEREVLDNGRLSALKTNAFGLFILYGYWTSAGWVLKLVAAHLAHWWPSSLSRGTSGKTDEFPLKAKAIEATREKPQG